MTDDIQTRLRESDWLYDTYGDGTLGIVFCRVCGLESETWEAVKHAKGCSAPAICDEIARLTSEVKRLKREGDWRAALEDSLEEQRK